MRIQPLAALAASALIATTLVGCSASKPQPSTDGVTKVVASTNVYGELVHEIGGSAVEVTSILHDASQDPHSFEGSARVQLEMASADLVIVNGGGYDDWATTLLKGADNPDAVVLTVAEVSGYDQTPATGEFNEHLWYDVPTISKLVADVEGALATIAPTDASTFSSNAAALQERLAGLEQRESALSARDKGAEAAITEPVPGYLLAASGFTIVTPEKFSEAIEEGTDVAPAVLAETLAQFASGEVRVLVYNEQTTSAETKQVLAAAKAADVPVVPVAETMPADTTYADWVGATLTQLEAVPE